MKSNTLVIATLTWTAGIVGCIDEHEVSSAEVATFSALSTPKEGRYARPVIRPEADEEQIEALARVPIFVGGDRIREVKGTQRPKPGASPTVPISEVKV